MEATFQQWPAARLPDKLPVLRLRLKPGPVSTVENPVKPFCPQATYLIPTFTDINPSTPTLFYLSKFPSHRNNTRDTNPAATWPDVPLITTALRYPRDYTTFSSPQAIFI